MSLLDRLERKFGKHPLERLTVAIIMTYVVGYLLYYINLINGVSVLQYIAFSPALIARGQVWRLVSWVLYPPESLSIWTVLMLVCIYQQGTMLERVWGNFKFDFYIFNGLLFTLLGGFIVYAVTGAVYVPISTYYIMLSVFLGLALTFPDMQFNFMFLIPIKAKYLVIIYAIYMIYEIIAGGSVLAASEIIASGINMAVFFFLYRKGPSLTRNQRETRKRFRSYMSGYGNNSGNRGAGYGNGHGGSRNGSGSGSGAGGTKIDYNTFGGDRHFVSGDGRKIPIHRCAVCGRTELDDPNLEFRFCSKCNGNYEYCQDHINNHVHVK